MRALISRRPNALKKFTGIGFRPAGGLITKLPSAVEAMHVVSDCASLEVQAGALKPDGAIAGRVLNSVSPNWSTPWTTLNGGAELIPMLGDTRRPKGSTRLPLMFARCRTS